MAKHSYGEKHMDRGASYRDTHQGYRSDAGKPKGSYGKPRAGYIDQSGMPNASKSKAYSYMSQAEGARDQAGNSGGTYGSSSTNAGASPGEGSMDSTYKKKKKK